MATFPFPLSPFLLSSSFETSVMRFTGNSVADSKVGGPLAQKLNCRCDKRTMPPLFKYSRQQCDDKSAE
jgi:hypothetical protein